MKIKYLITYTLAAATLFSCSEKNIPDDLETGKSILEFNTVVDGMSNPLEAQQDTKVSGTEWSSGDKITVFAYHSSSNVIYVDNRTFITNGNGRFTHETESDLIEFDGLSIDLKAFHPQLPVSDGKIGFDISDQTDPQDLDLLYSDNATGYTNGTVLRFTHQMSKIRFVIKGSPGVTLTNNISVSLQNVPSQAAFDIYEGSFSIEPAPISNIPMTVSFADGTATAEAFIFPSESLSGVSVKITLDGSDIFTHELGDNRRFEKGKIYSTTLQLTDSEGATNANYGWFETPVVREMGNSVFSSYVMPDFPSERNYSMLFDLDMRVAHWVAYPLYANCFGDASRSTNWTYDPSSNIPNSNQADIRTGSYPDQTWDRGHQIASSDRTYSAAANKTTFYVTNSTPQHGRLNQVPWKNLEEAAREWAKATDTLYVVTGGILKTDDDPVIQYTFDKSGNEVAIPKFYFKVFAKRTGSGYTTVGYMMKNEYPASNDYQPHIASVKEVEEATGYTFFPFVSDQTKATIVASEWPDN